MNPQRTIIAISIGILMCSRSEAALRFGLGSAVAKRSADLIDKAAANDPANAVGDNVAATMASCPSGPVYSTLPTDLSTIGAIDPLGHVNPSGHTFPADHIYFYASTTTSVSHTAYAPGNVHITTIRSTEYPDAPTPFKDYAIYFFGCRELKMYYAHIRTLGPSVLSQFVESDRDCSTYITSGTHYRGCNTNVNIPIQEGDVIGYGATSGAFDWGALDYRYTPIPFANPARHINTDQYYTVCPIDYFTSGPKAAMEAKLGRFDGGRQRTTAPVCGEYNQDVAGTARGFWYFPGAPNVPEDPHLALIFNNDYAPWENISVGTSLPNHGPAFFIFVPTHGGLVNREFSEVTPDNNIYCYDTFYDPIGQSGAYAGTIVILRMMNSTTLRIETQSAADCSAGSWAFTSNAVDFDR